MDDQAELRRSIDAIPYLYLEHFGPGDELLSLRLHVVEGIVASRRPHDEKDSSFNTVVDTYEKVREIVTENASLIEVSPASRRFVITFDRYLAFCARDETFTNPEENEDFSKKLRTYDKSKFLDFVRSSTWSLDDQTSLSHHAIVCLNVVIDVVCAGQPAISIEATT
ncbi:hypothetical protein [Rhizobium sp.]